MTEEAPATRGGGQRRGFNATPPSGRGAGSSVALSKAAASVSGPGKSGSVAVPNRPSVPQTAPVPSIANPIPAIADTRDAVGRVANTISVVPVTIVPVTVVPVAIGSVGVVSPVAPVRCPVDGSIAVSRGIVVSVIVTIAIRITVSIAVIRAGEGGPDECTCGKPEAEPTPAPPQPQPPPPQPPPPQPPRQPPPPKPTPRNRRGRNRHGRNRRRTRRAVRPLSWRGLGRLQPARPLPK